VVREDPPRSRGAQIGAPSGAGAALDWASIASAVRGQRIGHSVVYLETTGSTNDDARRLAHAGEPEGAVVLADEQTAGRGRAGKSRWLTPAATSIAMSVLLRPPLPPARLPLLSMLAGAATIEAVRAATGISCALKWPNDVMAGEHKLGGILVETALAGSSVSYAIAGIGLNANVRAAALGPFPDTALRPTSLWDESGVPVAREDVITALLSAMDRLYGELLAGRDDIIHRRYRRILDTLGRRITVTGAATAAVEGEALDVAGDGSLVLRLADGSLRSFAHGEVTVRPAESAATGRAPTSS
jgi:BirA family transcriptional regulator, biotin operon repressor / biotin---[acetyl-CoA-carboxylase] ligase